MAAYGMKPEERYRPVQQPLQRQGGPMLPPAPAGPGRTGTPGAPINPTMVKPTLATGDENVSMGLAGGVGDAPRAIDQFRPRGGQVGAPRRPGVPQRPRLTMPAPVTPVAPPVPVTPIVPPPPIDQGAPDFSANLRSDVYTPGEDKALSAAQKATQGALTNISAGDPYSKAAAAGEGRYRKLFGSGEVEAGPGVEAVDGGRYLDEQDAAVAGLGGPSRTELAQQALKDFEAQGEKALAARFRKVGQDSAKFGRTGLGAVNAELGSIQGDFERDRLSKMNELARDVSEGDINDRFRRVDATSGLRRGEAGLESGLRSEMRDERGYATGVNERNADRSFDRGRSAIDYAGRDADRDIQDRYDQFGAAGSLEDRVFSQGQRNRDEFRTERERQDSVAQRSLDNRIRERTLGNQEQERRLSRALALMQAGGKIPSLDELLAGG